MQFGVGEYPVLKEGQVYYYLGYVAGVTWAKNKTKQGEKAD